MKKGKVLTLLVVLFFTVFFIGCELFDDEYKSAENIDGGKDADQIIITFDSNGHGTETMDAQFETPGKKFSLDPVKFTADGYGFTGWNTEKDGSGTFYPDKAEIAENDENFTKDITLYAQWLDLNSLVGKGSAKFTVNAQGKQVYFTKGNVRYTPKTNKWEFAENQYDVIGIHKDGEDPTANEETDNTKRKELDKPIDLFCWGATGGADYCAKPWQLPEKNNDGYYDDYASKIFKVSADGPKENDVLTIDNKADWGYCFGGDNSPYRTLGGGDGGEWEYLLTKRETTWKCNVKRSVYSEESSGEVLYDFTEYARYAPVMLTDESGNNIIWGILIFPDGFKETDWDKSKMGDPPTIINSINCWTFPHPDDLLNKYKLTEFTEIEKAGCVFLPNSCSQLDANAAWYWTSTAASKDTFGLIFDDYYAWALMFDVGNPVVFGTPGYYLELDSEGKEKKLKYSKDYATSLNRFTQCAVRLIVDADKLNF